MIGLQATGQFAISAACLQTIGVIRQSGKGHLQSHIALFCRRAGFVRTA